MPQFMVRYADTQPGYHVENEAGIAGFSSESKAECIAECERRNKDSVPVVPTNPAPVSVPTVTAIQRNKRAVQAEQPNEAKRRLHRAASSAPSELSSTAQSSAQPGRGRLPAGAGQRGRGGAPGS